MLRGLFVSLALITALGALSGCAAWNEPRPPGQTATAPPDGGEDACGRARYAHLIGQDAADIDPTALPARTRIITPDMMVTEDYRADRLNVMVGADGRVGSLGCY